MLEVNGKYTQARIYAKTIEDGVIEQVQSITNHPIFKGCSVAIQADCHVGKGCVIGFTSEMPKNGEIIPNIIGVDIHCGMYVVKLKNVEEIDYERLDKVIRRNIPYGRDGRNKFSNLVPESFIEETKRICKDYIKEDWVNHVKKIGSLGDGNHFISIEQGTTGAYLIVHSGSRNIGSKLAQHFQRIAGEKNPYIIPELSYLTGIDTENYLACSDYCKRYAHLSRQIMAKDILVGMRWDTDEQFETVHNYIGEDNVIRKGAISAKEGEKVLIPLNMKDGSLIAIGKGNKEFNNSAPHGAGRVLPRKLAKETLSMEEYKKQVEGIYTTCIDISTLDESPMAYKNGNEIVEQISPTATVIDKLTPLYNFKAVRNK